MSFYSRFVFPRVVNWVMSTGQMKKARTAILKDVHGDIFEIGFGTGLNLAFYPDHVQKLVTADINPGMSAMAQRNIDESHIDVDCRTINGENLPLDDDSFDSVVCTWTLCSIQNVEKALGEVRRILKPEGRFFFVEHGLADDEKTRRWQHRLTPLQKIIGDGCHLNRNIKELLLDSGFRFTEFENYHMEKTPKVAGYMYQGVAVKA